MKTEKFVINKACDHIRDAYHSKKPIIMLDTEEIELANRIAVSLVNKGIIQMHKKTRYEGTNIEEYIRISGIKSKTLEEYPDFSKSINALEKLYTDGKKIDPTKPMNPMLVLLKADYSETNAGRVIAPDLAASLKNYVDCYLSSNDDFSALRSSCVLVYGDPTLIPGNLKGYTEIITIEYPKFEEIRETVLTLAEEAGYGYDKPFEANEVARELLGFSLMEVEFYTKKMLHLFNEEGKPKLKDSKERNKIILDAKIQKLKQYGGLLKLYYEDEEKTDEVGGMKTYTEWVEKVIKTMSSEDEFLIRVGASHYKGTLLVGVPGTGKSEAAKVFYRKLYKKCKRPMLRLDIDALMGGVVGLSEKNLREALYIAEVMSPCILWIDEIDKGLSGATSSSGDGGTFKRMFGHLLTWLQEKNAPCFVFATANDISKFPPELFRSGRFDALFSVFMPTHEECKKIFEEQMKRAEKRREDGMKELGIYDESKLFDHDPQNGCFTEDAFKYIMELFTEGIDVKEEPERVKFVTGADIEKIVKEALIKTGATGGNISLTEWLKKLKETINDPIIETQGSCQANFNKIASCYVRLLRNNFVPAGPEKPKSAEDPDERLFKKEKYKQVINKKEDGNTTISAYYDEEECSSDKPYDIALFETLKKRINIMASEIETNDYKDQCK